VGSGASPWLTPTPILQKSPKYRRVVIQVYGSSTYDFKTELDAALSRAGTPTRKAKMLTTTTSDGRVLHFPVHHGEKVGVVFPTMRFTRKQLNRHIELYGPEFTGMVPLVKEATKPQVLELHRAGKTSAEIASDLGIGVRSVERHLAKTA
jgi:hypothetical protein